MLNWIAIYVGKWLFELDGPLQGAAPSLPRSEIIFDSATLWIIWKPYLHFGLLIAIVVLFIYFILLNRTTLGYEVRAVGFNTEAARYSGISVPEELLPRARDLRRVRRAGRNGRPPRRQARGRPE